ncbi:MAG: Gfo/Idh/MocA family oxidoreductase [Spirochaetota bacterium]
MSVRIGVIGAGFIGRVHMQMFGETAGAEVVGCTDAALELAAAAAKQFGVPRVFESADELITSPDVDAVVVAVPNRMHDPRRVPPHRLSFVRHGYALSLRSDRISTREPRRRPCSSLPSGTRRYTLSGWSTRTSEWIDG